MAIRLRLFAALLLSIAFSAKAEEKIISGTYDLKAFSAYLPSATDRTVIARIDNYANPGQLRIDQPLAAPETLIVKRAYPDSDGVINVDSTFIDIKGFTGTLILKNLAFRLKPKSALIAGYDPNRLNHNLVLDSCTLYADTLDGLFLSWQGDTASRVDIRNSWFVARSSATNAASIQIAAGTVTLSNCLLNFAGLFYGTAISKRFDAFSNTANRVQFKLVGSPPIGAEDPIYTFAQNFVAFHGPANALGGDPFYFLMASGFSDLRSVVQSNRTYNVWKGFDAPLGAKGIQGNKIPTDTNYDGKRSSELWDWYTDKTDSTTGLLSGNSKLTRFNVLPGKTFVDSVLRIDSARADTLRVSFRTADYPRAFRTVLGPAPVLTDSAYRLRAPFAGALSFGPFQVDSIRHTAAAANGKPILLTQAATGAFQPQSGGTRAGEAPSVWRNRLPTARVFALLDSGNTPHGHDVEPALPSAEKYEHLRFAQVDQAGQTLSYLSTDRAVPDSLRSLDRAFSFGTTAVVNTQITFASARATSPVPWAAPQDSALFWYWKTTGSAGNLPATALLPAVAAPAAWGDDLLAGTVAYKTADGRGFALLVERLSIHAAQGYRKPLPGASLLSNSKAGYQLHWDTSTVDAARFGSASAGYAFTWTGRGDGDSLYLILMRPAPEAQVFVQVPGRAEPDAYPSPLDTSGNFRIAIGPQDAGKVFFAAVKYNVLAGPPPFTGVVDGVSVIGLSSSTPGNLSFRDLGLSDVANLGSNKDSVFRNANFLGGKSVSAAGLTLTGDYDIGFQIRPYLSSDKVEIWWLDNGTWVSSLARSKLSQDSVYARPTRSATHIIAVERFQAPGIYVRDSSYMQKDTLVFTVAPAVQGVIPVTGYCLEVRSIRPDGTLAESGCVRKAVNEPTRVAIDSSQGYAYRIIYFEGTEQAPVRLTGDYVYPEQLGWDVKALLDAPGNADLSALPQGQWRLVALPAQAKLRKSLAHGVRTGEAVRDTLMALGLKTLAGGKADFDSAIHYDTLTLRPGSAILLACSHPLTLTLDSVSAAIRRSARPETLAVKAGWNLVGNPYPVPLNRKSVKAKSGRVFRMWELNHDKTLDRYTWDSVKAALPAFRGFAFYADKADSLYLDPGDTGTASPAAAAARMASGAGSAAGPGPAARVRVGIDAGFGEAGMALVRGAGEYPVRYLSAPAPGLELRVGGDGGFLILPIDDPGRIELPVEIRSDRDGTARFALGEGGVPPAFALIDERTGAIYDAASAASLPLRKGTQEYRLVAGDAGFVAARTGAFLAGAPSGIGLSQNYPNPVRGLTRIAFDWPATREQDRRAFLEILDLRGRRMAMKRIDGIRVGRQVVELDASAWKPGLYLYRLNVIEGGRTTRLQKRMLVSP